MHMIRPARKSLPTKYLSEAFADDYSGSFFDEYFNISCVTRLSTPRFAKKSLDDESWEAAN